MQPFKLPIVCMLIILTMAGCTNTGGTESLKSLHQIQAIQTRENSSATKKFREQAIRETAISVGAQSGLAKQTKIINATLTKHSKKLDHIFNFQQMLLEDNILCPVLIASKDNFNIDPNGESLRIADRAYLILKQAKFVTTAPNWRNYLWLEHLPPQKPDNALLPISRQERKTWKEATTRGWNYGIKQANSMFKNNLNKLAQDFQGMILYKVLLARSMVSTPHVGLTTLGITGNSNEMRVNDQVLRITAMPGLKLNPEEWNTVIQQ